MYEIGIKNMYVKYVLICMKYVCEICMKHVQRTSFKANLMCAPSFLVRAHLTICVRAQRRGNIAQKYAANIAKDRFIISSREKCLTFLIARE